MPGICTTDGGRRATERIKAMPPITEMYCFAISDRGDDDEGVPAITGPDGVILPLVGADLTRIESLIPYAQQIANEKGKPIRIYRFSAREQIGEISPREKATPPVQRAVHVKCEAGHEIIGFVYLPGLTAAQKEFGGTEDITLTEANAIDYLRLMVKGMIERQSIDPWCSLCHSPRERWIFEDLTVEVNGNTEKENTK